MFNLITASGGGSGVGSGQAVARGGSGGGSTDNNRPACEVAQGNAGGFTKSEGNNGGRGDAASNAPVPQRRGAGGGGATAVGANGTPSGGGNGGAGAPNLIDCGGTPFSTTAFAGGGAGS